MSQGIYTKCIRFALDAETGAVLWVTVTGGDVNSSPVVEKGIVYVGSDDNYVYALDAATGAQVWSYDTGGAVHSTAVIEKKVLFIGSTSSQVWAFFTK